MSEFDPVERAGHTAALALAEPAVQTAGYRTQLVEPDDPALVPELIVELGDDEAGRRRTLRMGFIPVGDEMDASSFLQLWSPLPFAAAESRRDDLARAVTVLNEHVAIGRFGMQADGSLYYRYVLALAKHTLVDGDLLAEVVRFVDFHQAHFGDFVEGVADGSIAVEVLDEVIRRAG